MFEGGTDGASARLNTGGGPRNRLKPTLIYDCILRSDTSEFDTQYRSH